MTEEERRKRRKNKETERGMEQEEKRERNRYLIYSMRGNVRERNKKEERENK